jgi:hypothetical protein
MSDKHPALRWHRLLNISGTSPGMTADAEPPVQTTLPHPNVHLVIEQGEAKIYGIQSGRFTRVLQGRQRVFGIKFQAVAFIRYWVSRFLRSITGSVPYLQHWLAVQQCWWLPSAKNKLLLLCVRWQNRF